MDMSTSIWIKPSGTEVTVDTASYDVAASLGWKPKEEHAQVVAQKKKSRPHKPAAKAPI
jgi:hypothetical protein|tara:strand:- start:5025 stop:5201 length:177 start_codon:yes stop_codon:yes gene_type:complete